MNKNAKKWVEALRSGKYTQCTDGFLRKNDGYCCFGLACQLYIDSGNKLNVSHELHNDGIIYYYDGEAATLPNSVKKWLNMKNCCGVLGEGDNLIIRNDWGTSFAEIANIIEENEDILFHKE